MFLKNGKDIIHSTQQDTLKKAINYFAGIKQMPVDNFTKIFIVTEIKMDKVEVGSKVKVHYIGRLMDGTEFDNSRSTGRELFFTVGDGKVIKGFDKAVLEMVVGQTKKISLKPMEAYGDIKKEAIQEISKTDFPEDFKLTEGESIEGRTQSGQPMRATVKEVKNNSVILDLNHPLAGKDLDFEIELLEVLK